jgi:hypothetical protein
MACSTGGSQNHSNLPCHPSHLHWPHLQKQSPLLPRRPPIRRRSRQANPVTPGRTPIPGPPRVRRPPMADGRWWRPGAVSGDTLPCGASGTRYVPHTRTTAPALKKNALRAQPFHHCDIDGLSSFFYYMCHLRCPSRLVPTIVVRLWHIRIDLGIPSIGP